MKEKAGKNRNDYKKTNRGLALKMIATAQCFSRIELVEKTGLSKMTISNIVGEMLKRELLAEGVAVKTGDSGRNPIKLIISPKAPKLIGLVIMRNYCEAVLCSLDMKVLDRERYDYEVSMDKEKLIRGVYRLIDTLIYKESNVLAIGLASIGPVNVRQGIILKPFYFYGIENVEIVSIVSERYKLPVFFDHDNQSAVSVESLFGNGRGYQDILLVGANQGGVGCGILGSDHLYCNGQGFSPEMGHVSVDYAGKLCVCGSRGCLETYLNTPEILRRLYEKTGKYYTYEAYSNILDDPGVEEIFNDAVEKLATAIVSTINILNSELILLANDFVYWNDKYLRLLEDKVNKQKFTKWTKPVVVKKAYYRQDSPLMGAACNALTPVFEGELLFDN